MLTRIISGVIGALVMLAILLFGGVIGFAITAAILGTIAVFELLRAADFGWGYRVPAMLVAFLAPLCLLWNVRVLFVMAVVYGLLVVTLGVMRHETLTPERAGLLVLLPAVAASGFTALSLLRGMGEDGLFYICLALVIPWLSDTGAYFVGVLFGRHKLCPVISPKKTVEGLIGGIATSIAASALTVWIYGVCCGHPIEVSWLSLLGVAAVGAPLSVIGDLFASVVKRRFGVKDYGNLMPGHGGVMDRFDSVLPVAVLLLCWTKLLPLLI